MREFPSLLESSMLRYPLGHKVERIQSHDPWGIKCCCLDWGTAQNVGVNLWRRDRAQMRRIRARD